MKLLFYTPYGAFTYKKPKPADYSVLLRLQADNKQKLGSFQFQNLVTCILSILSVHNSTVVSTLNSLLCVWSLHMLPMPAGILQVNPPLKKQRSLG